VIDDAVRAAAGDGEGGGVTMATNEADDVLVERPGDEACESSTVATSRRPTAKAVVRADVDGDLASR
jgi:hypothetical protein